MSRRIVWLCIGFVASALLYGTLFSKVGAITGLEAILIMDHWTMGSKYFAIALGLVIVAVGSFVIALLSKGETKSK